MTTKPKTAVEKKPKAQADIKTPSETRKVPASKPSINPFVQQHPTKTGRSSHGQSKGAHRGGR